MQIIAAPGPPTPGTTCIGGCTLVTTPAGSRFYLDYWDEYYDEDLNEDVWEWRNTNGTVSCATGWQISNIYLQCRRHRVTQRAYWQLESPGGANCPGGGFTVPVVWLPAEADCGPPFLLTAVAQMTPPGGTADCFGCYLAVRVGVCTWCQTISAAFPPVLRATFSTWSFPTEAQCPCIIEGGGVVMNLRKNTTVPYFHYFGRLRPSATGGDVVHPGGWGGCNWSGGLPGQPLDAEYIIDLTCHDDGTGPSAQDCRWFELGTPPDLTVVQFALTVRCCRFLAAPGRVPALGCPGYPAEPPGPEECVGGDSLWWYNPYAATAPEFPVTSTSFAGCLGTLGPPCDCGQLARTDSAGSFPGMTCRTLCTPRAPVECQPPALRSSLDPLRLIFEGIESGGTLGPVGDRVGHTCVCAGSRWRVTVTI